MPDLAATDYTMARLVIERGLALVYVIAFAVALRQFPALCRERGLEPAPSFLARTRFLDAPSLFHWGYSDRRLLLLSWIGMAVASPLLLGLPQQTPLPVTMFAWFTLWVRYQSISNIGSTLYSSAGSRRRSRRASWPYSWATTRSPRRGRSSSRFGGSPSGSNSAPG